VDGHGYGDGGSGEVFMRGVWGLYEGIRWDNRSLYQAAYSQKGWLRQGSTYKHTIATAFATANYALSILS
jgi:hypothetical protein